MITWTKRLLLLRYLISSDVPVHGELLLLYRIKPLALLVKVMFGPVSEFGLQKLYGKCCRLFSVGV